MKRQSRQKHSSRGITLHDRTEVYGTKRMFSAASFFDVIEAAKPHPRGVRQQLGEPATVPAPPAVVTFYGFRGGAGRTMALAHVAIMLAQRGLRVAALDFDIEAPGLHVAFGADTPNEGQGLVPLLQESLTLDSDDPVLISEHVQVLTPREGVGKVFLFPAGRVTRTYLAQIEELGVGLWHEPDRSPIERILTGTRSEDPDVILVDCRTGFSGISASLLFHHADLVVVFLPLTEQVWDGVEVLLQAVASARSCRDRRPGLLFVPSMIPPGETGREKVNRYLARLSERYAAWLPRDTPPQDLEEEGPLDEEPWLSEGIVWDSRISADGSVRQPFIPGGPWGIFQPLCERIVETLDLATTQRTVEPVPANRILAELQIAGSIGFAEDLSEEQIQRIMVPSDSVKASIDRASALIVGAKGSGKTLLWRYLVEQRQGEVVRLPSDTRYVVGHAPKFDLDPQKRNLSADAFKELEHTAKIHKRSTYKAFWLLYALFRLSLANPEIDQWLRRHIATPLRSTWRTLAAGRGAPDFSALLNLDSISTAAEDTLASLDEWLARQPQQYVLAFDGLDNGFQSGKPAAWYQRREQFVTGLLQVVADWRSRLKRVQFKLFLREDIYLSIELQNRSHLDAAKHELRFGPSDLWQLALKIANTSPSFRSTMISARESTVGLYLGEESELRALLNPLWGRTIEKGKKAYTANYILKRTSDAQGRLFPRTFIQMLDMAVKVEKQQDQRFEPDRVLRFKSLREGVIEASKRRTEDLRTEYVELKPYLESLRGAPAVASAKTLIRHMKGKISNTEFRLHLGAGGWQKVLNQLTTVGVMAKKPADPNEIEKFSVALLYRDGLGMKSAGLR